MDVWNDNCSSSPFSLVIGLRVVHGLVGFCNVVSAAKIWPIINHLGDVFYYGYIQNSQSKTDAGLSQQLSLNHPILASFLSRQKNAIYIIGFTSLSRGVPYND